MSDVDPTMPTYQRFLLAAELLGISPHELARRLSAPLGKVGVSPSRIAHEAAGHPEAIDVHAKYLGRVIEAVFDRSTNTVTVTSGELAGKSYTSPSSAAIAVVEALNPGREAANTNGRLFWLVKSTGQPLRSVIGQR